LTVLLTVTSNPTSGITSLESDGSFTYTPNADFFGSDSFEYKVSDGEHEVTATVAITVTDVNDPPVISDPIDIIVEATGLLTLLSVIGLIEPTVTDLFDATPTTTNDAPNVFPLGDTVVVWTSSDTQAILQLHHN